MVQVQVSADIHLFLLCADCGDERRFEQPPCDDGHGADCPEWACVECGAAILLGPHSIEADAGAGASLSGRQAGRPGALRAGRATVPGQGPGSGQGQVPEQGPIAAQGPVPVSETASRHQDHHPGDDVQRRYVA